MNRYILRYQGNGDKPQAAMEMIREIPHLLVIAESPSMLLVEAPLEELQKGLRSLPDWSVTSERFFDIPDPRPKIDSKLPLKVTALRK